MLVDFVISFLLSIDEKEDNYDTILVIDSFTLKDIRLEAK